MANTYSQILIQAVFAVEARQSLIKPEWKEDLFKYIGGIFREKKQKLLAIGGIEDHIHLLFGLKPNIAISDLIRDVKASSSGFVNDERFTRGDFAGRKGLVPFRIPDLSSMRSPNTFSIRKSIMRNDHSAKNISDYLIASRSNTRTGFCSTGSNKVPLRRSLTILLQSRATNIPLLAELRSTRSLLIFSADL